MTVHRHGEHGESEAAEGVLRGLRIAVELSIVILVIEGIGALLSHSLALTVDAIHNVPDILAFAVSWAALRGTQSGVSAESTFGSHRTEVFAGILNGSLVLVTGLAFGYEAVVALASRSAVGGTVNPEWLLVALVPTLALRLVNVQILGKVPRRVRDLNLRSVIVHLASDLAITATLGIAGIVLLVRPGLASADDAAALVIAAILVYESIPIFREGWSVLSEQTPKGVSIDRVMESALRDPDVVEIHDVHVWAVCSTLVCLTAHVGVKEMPLRQSSEVVDRLRRRMESEFGIVHSTFQVEPAGGPG